jgi:hypothetical protein
MLRKPLSTSGDRLSALKERERALRAAIAVELEREQKRKARERDRLVRIVGSALLEEAARSPNFKIMLKQTLNTAVVNEKFRTLLAKLGWL